MPGTWPNPSVFDLKTNSLFFYQLDSFLPPIAKVERERAFAASCWREIALFSSSTGLTSYDSPKSILLTCSAVGAKETYCSESYTDVSTLGDSFMATSIISGDCERFPTWLNTVYCRKPLLCTLRYRCCVLGFSIFGNFA